MAKVDVQEASEDTTVANVPAETETPAAAPVAAEPVAQQPRKKLSLAMPKITKRVVFEALLVAAVIGLALWSWVLYSDKSSLNDELAQARKNPQTLINKQTTDLIASVRSLYPTLPTDETPTIAQVSDAAKAKKQSAFFANAQNGDKVLMYVKSGQAFLYRPSTNQLIIVAPLTFSGNNNAKTTN